MVNTKGRMTYHVVQLTITTTSHYLSPSYLNDGCNR
jgi:hypothetical protein